MNSPMNQLHGRVIAGGAPPPPNPPTPPHTHLHTSILPTFQTLLTACSPAALSLQDRNEHTAFIFSRPPTQEGLSTLALIERAAFGSSHTSAHPSTPQADLLGGGAAASSAAEDFMDRAMAAPSERARHALALCETALLHALAPANALSVHLLAEHAARGELARAAALCALRCFEEVATQDHEGLAAMDEEQLIGLLANDHLVVSCVVK
jgi:hypothetical protein